VLELPGQMTGEEHDDSGQEDDRQVTLPVPVQLDRSSIGIAGIQGKENDRAKGNMEEKQ
jgi:hypothetical protein